MKKLLCIAVLSFILLIGSSVFAEGNTGNAFGVSDEINQKLNSSVILCIGNSKAYVNGSESVVDSTNNQVSPFIKGERTLVPVRFISEGLGAEVAWDDASQKVDIIFDDEHITFTIGSNKMSVISYDSGKEVAAVALDEPAQIINERTFVPLRALAEALNKKIFWDDRGLIVISDIENIFDPVKDKKSIDQVVGMFEVNNNEQIVRNYINYLATLSKDDINSISSGIERYKSVVTDDKYLNDDLFREFYSFYNEVIYTLNIPEENNVDVTIKWTEEEMNNNGIEQKGSEAGNFIGEKKGFLISDFSSALTDGETEFIKILDSEILPTYLIEDGGLWISRDDLADRIIDWEKYADKYGSYDAEVRYANASIDYYMELYLAGSFGRTPIFNYESKKIEDEAKNSYERFISNHSDSKYCTLIKGYYDIIKKNDFMLSQEAIDYLKKNNIDTYWLDRIQDDIIEANIETSKGIIVVELNNTKMPITVTNFAKLANDKFYDNLTFHRVEDWVIQGGDPNGNGTGGSKDTIKLETHPDLNNIRGAIAMARSSNPDSATSQFYILKTDAPGLDGQYAVFGNVISGMDVVDKIEIGDKILRIQIVK